jgi:hypothetical protein
MQCLAGATVVDEGSAFLDKRYFFVDREGRGQTVCGFARKISATFLRNGHEVADDFLDPTWKHKIDFRGRNPSALWFFFEQVLLSSIATNGCSTAGDDFRGKPRTICSKGLFPDPWSSTGASLFVPLRYNYPAVDGILSYQSNDRKFGKVIAIQITIAGNHSNSEKKFLKPGRTGLPS